MSAIIGWFNRVIFNLGKKRLHENKNFFAHKYNKYRILSYGKARTNKLVLLLGGNGGLSNNTLTMELDNLAKIGHAMQKNKVQMLIVDKSYFDGKKVTTYKQVAKNTLNELSELVDKGIVQKDFPLLGGSSGAAVVSAMLSFFDLKSITKNVIFFAGPAGVSFHNFTNHGIRMLVTQLTGFDFKSKEEDFLWIDVDREDNQLVGYNVAAIINYPDFFVNETKPMAHLMKEWHGAMITPNPGIYKMPTLIPALAGHGNMDSVAADKLAETIKGWK